MVFGLEHYEAIVAGNQMPRFFLARETGFLNEKIGETECILENCELCERSCGVDRLHGVKGFCGAGVEPRVFGAHPHYGEEAELVPSGTIFFSGCTMRCVYCQNAPQSVNAELGEKWGFERIAQCMEGMQAQGCKNINFVGGDPTPNLLAILKALSITKASLPVVWNSNSYYSEKTARLLEGIVDVFLLDFRYFSNECAEKYSDSPFYVETAKSNLLKAKKNAELLVRVLVMPSHIECCAKPILEWIAKNTGKNTRVNIMDQYYPAFNSFRFPEINKRLSRLEFVQVLEFAESLGLKNLA
ncbi:MAG: radical SAM protein [Candidatus Diapherotrites archaeon]